MRRTWMSMLPAVWAAVLLSMAVPAYSIPSGASDVKPKPLSHNLAAQFLEEARNNTTCKNFDKDVTFAISDSSSKSNRRSAIFRCAMSGSDTVVDVSVSDGDDYKMTFNGGNVTTLMNGEDVSSHDSFVGFSALAPVDIQYLLLLADKLTYSRPSRVSGRQVQVFERDDDVFVDGAHVLKVRLFIDNEWKIPLQVDFFGREINPLRRVSVRSFKKVGSEWTVKGIDISNFLSKKSTKLQAIKFGKKDVR